jgi:hypothetical protein
MNIRILIAGILSVACSLSAQAQDPIAEICAEFLAPDQWPEPMSEDERTALEASIRETLVSVAEMVDRLPDTLAEVSVAEPADCRADKYPNEYWCIRDWRNPSVIILPEGVEVRSSFLSNGSLRAPIGALRCILNNLPDSAWPHGRAIQAGNSSVAGSLADMVPERRNRASVETIFDQLRIEVVWLAQ